MYPLSIAGNVSPDRLNKYFQNEVDELKVIKRIRDMVIFAGQNVVGDPAFSRLDLISCRNLLIYLKPEMQDKLMKVFFQSMNPDGILFLGSSETIGERSDLFSTINCKYRIFRRRPTSPQTEMEIFPTWTPRMEAPAGSRREEEWNLSQIAQSILLEQYSPPAVFIDEDGEIMYVSGRIGNYLELAPGKTSTNIFSMAKEAIRYELSPAIRKVVEKKETVVVNGLRVKAEGNVQAVNIVVRPIMRTETMGNLFLVMFEEAAAPERPQEKAEKDEVRPPGRSRELELELQYTRQRLQSTVEEMHASREEFTSMDEELQAANEELTASKEEMQSLNEELLTVNSELQAKITALTRANSDMKNLLDSTDIATIFLYKDLKIRNFTPAASGLIKLIPADVGRSITDFSSKITSDDIVADAMGVIKTIITVNKQIWMNDGRWYAMRILPYRTVEDVFDGVVITFNDITLIKNLEESLVGSRDYSDNIINMVGDSLLVLNSDMEIISTNRSFYNTFKVTHGDIVGKKLSTIGEGQWDIPELKRLLSDIIPRQKEIYNYVVEHDFPHIGHRVMVLNARLVISQQHKSELILLAIEDLSRSQEILEKVKQLGGGA